MLANTPSDTAVFLALLYTAFSVLKTHAHAHTLKKGNGHLVEKPHAAFQLIQLLPLLQTLELELSVLLHELLILVLRIKSAQVES